MSIQINYLDNETGILFLGEETISGSDILISIKAFFSSTEKMEALKYCLIVYSKIIQFNVSNADIQIIASQNEKMAKYKKDGVIAIVADDDFVFGVSRMWEFIIENTGINWETMVFRDRDSAESWLKRKVKEHYNIEIAIT